jgi:NAD(P)-dependent dehydrogenase (short-subunit alcohol dehydrogenase family)
MAIEADQRNDAAVAAALEQAESEFGRIDILVNNAAVCAVVGILEMKAEGSTSCWTSTSKARSTSSATSPRA